MHHKHQCRYSLTTITDSPAGFQHNGAHRHSYNHIYHNKETEMKKTLLQVRDLDIGYKGKYLYKSVSFDINEGDCIMLCGANGSGKTTLMKAIAGMQGTDCRITMIPSRIPKVIGRV